MKSHATLVASDVTQESESFILSPSTRHPMPLKVRETVAPTLQLGVAFGVDLERQAKQAHWTLRGASFSGLHELFDEIADDARRLTDLCAERLMTLGGVADGTMATVASQSSLPRYPVGLLAAERQIELITRALGRFILFAYGAIKSTDDAGDPTTADIFTEITRGLELRLWMLEAHTR